MEKGAELGLGRLLVERLLGLAALRPPAFFPVGA